MSHTERKIKLLFISSDKFPPFRVDVAVLFAKEITGRGHRIDWILQSEKKLKKNSFVQWQGSQVWAGATDNGVTLLARFKKHAFGILNDCRMFTLASSNGYNCIQVKDKFISALLAIITAKLNRIKFTYWLSYPFPEASLARAKDGTARYPLLYLIRGFIQKHLLYRIILPSADHIFVQSEQMKRDIVANGIKAETITPVPMGVEIEKMDFAPCHVPTGNSEKRIIYSGTLMKTRRLEFLIQVLALVVSKIPETRLFLVGAGDDSSDILLLKKEAKKLGVEKSLIITGFLPMAEAWQLVQTADVCLSPFYPSFVLNSTSPTKLIEYMALGKAVVANDHPEQRLVLEESGGGYCVPYNSHDFAEAVIDLLNNPDRAEEMGNKGRAYVKKNRTYTTIADMVEKKYLNILFTEADNI